MTQKIITKTGAKKFTSQAPAATASKIHPHTIHPAVSASGNIGRGGGSFVALDLSMKEIEENRNMPSYMPGGPVRSVQTSLEDTAGGTSNQSARGETNYQGTSGPDLKTSLHGYIDVSIGVLYKSGLGSTTVRPVQDLLRKQ